MTIVEPYYEGDLLDVAASIERADDWWRSCADKALQTLAGTGQPFTADDLTEMGVPDPDSPARWGALFAGAKAARLIVPVGYQPSTRPTRNGGVCRVWVGRQAA